MKILISRLTDGTFGGAELSAIDHARSYEELGHTVLLITNIEKSRTGGIKTVWTPWPHTITGPLKILSYPLAMFYQVIITLLSVLFFRPNVMNPHSRDDQVMQTLLKPIHRTPVVWKDPADLRHFLARERNGFLWKLNNSLLHKAVQEADAIYTLNSSERELILKSARRLKLKEPRIEVIPSSIRYDTYDLKEKRISPANKTIISTVIRLIKNKGVQYLIEAYEQANLQNCELWIVGNGPYEEALKQLAKDRKDIFFHGFQSNVSRYFASTDIFVQPAEFEGWGRNVKEAMYFGLPVIGSNVGGIAKQITDNENGLLFPVGDVGELSKQIIRLVDDKKLRNKLGIAAKKKALADGDYVDLIRDRIIPLFQEYTGESK